LKVHVQLLKRSSVEHSVYLVAIVSQLRETCHSLEGRQETGVPLFW